MPTSFFKKVFGLIVCVSLISSFVKAQTISLDSLFAVAKHTLYSEGDYPKAISLYGQCMKEAQKQKDLSKTGTAFIGIGIAYQKSGNYEEAVGNYFKALRIYQQAGNSIKEAGTLKNIGTVYRYIKTYDKSYDYLQSALQKFTALKDSTGISNVLNDIGLMFMDEERNEQALFYFKKVITNYSAYAVSQVLAYAYNNAALIYSKKGEYQLAYAYYLSALQRMQTIKEDYGIGLILINIGDLLNKQKKYKEALRYNQEGLTIAQRIGSKELMANAYKSVADSYRQLSDYKQSNSYLDKLLLINDTIFRTQSAKSYAEMEARYQNEKKQKEIALLKQENTIKGIELVSEQKTRYFLIAILTLIVGASVLLYRSYLLKQKLNKALHVANEKLDEANHSKTKLLSIITHDLRGPVSHLFNFLQLQREAPARLTLLEQERFTRKINTAAENLLDMMEDVLIWSKSQMEKFSVIPEEVNIHELFTEVIALHATIAANKSIGMTQQVLPADLALYTDPNLLKIILRNILSNSLKFTPEGGHIELAAVEKNSFIEVSVSDTGNGIAPNQLRSIFDWNTINSDSAGLGLKLVKEFTEKLCGTIAVHSQVSKGTRFVLCFPCNVFAGDMA